MLKFIFIIVLLFMNSNSTMACSCKPMGNDFFETVFLHNLKIKNGEWPATNSLSIVIAEVKNYVHMRAGPYPTEMILKVSGNLQGNIKSKELIVQGDDGTSCMPYVTIFPIGKKFIFALNQKNKDFYISSCGFYSKEIFQPN